MLCPSSERNSATSPTDSSVTDRATIFMVCVSTITCSFTKPRFTFHFLPIHSPRLCCLSPVASAASILEWFGSDTMIIPPWFVSTSSVPIRLRSWLKEGVLGSPIIFPMAPSSCLYWTPIPTLRAAASMISVSEYRYGAPTFPSFARLTSPSHSGLYSMNMSAPRLTYFSLSVFVMEGVAKLYDQCIFRSVRTAPR